MLTPALLLCRISSAHHPSRPLTPTLEDAIDGVHALSNRTHYPCAQGSPLAFQPASSPLWRWAPSGPSNPSLTFPPRPYPAAVIAWAALKLRCPERQMKNNSLS